MNNAGEFVLIKGSFSAAEAKELLLNLINHKINFHELRNFSAQIRSGERDPHSESRIEELRKSRLGVMELIRAQEESTVFQIDCSVSITPIREATSFAEMLGVGVGSNN